MKKGAFTLVELIVVITILAILATVGFISFSGYLAGARDTNRLAQVKGMSDALELYSTRKDLPIPDDKIDIIANGTTISYQGYIGASVLETIEYTEKGLDPKDQTYFTYYLTKTKKYFQLITFLEESNEDTLAKMNLNTTLAIDYSSRYGKTQGKKLGILTDDDNNPVQELSDITESGSLDIVTTSENYTGHIDDITTISGTGSVLSGLTDNANCNRLKVFKGQRDSGNYTINPSGLEEIEVYCNMELGGGGWTLVATTADDDNDTWTYDNKMNLSDDTIIGSLSNKNSDYKSLAYSQIKFKDMMFEDKQGEWGAYDEINPEYNETIAEWMPTTLACAFGEGRDYYLTSGSISINKGVDDTQQDRGLFFTVYENENGCSPTGDTAQHNSGPTWGYRQNGGLSPDDPGLMGWGPGIGLHSGNSIQGIELGDARLGIKTAEFEEGNDGDYIYWYVR